MIDRLHKFYFGSLVNPKKEENINVDNYYIIKIGQDQLYIPNTQLTEDAKELLHVITNNSSDNNSKLNSWEKLLLNGEVDFDAQENTIQLVYLKSKNFANNDFKIWKNIMKESLSNILEVIFIEDDLIVAILDYKNTDKSFIDLFIEVIRSLDQDFDTLTQGMIGQAIQVNEKTAETYAFENQLFKKNINKQRNDQINKLSDVLVGIVSEEIKKHDIKTPKLSTYISESNEAKILVRLLFENQGNLSKTAEALYIHRNTLTYRVNQFYKKTGFDLLYFSDLIVCYLLS